MLSSFFSCFFIFRRSKPFDTLRANGWGYFFYLKVFLSCFNFTIRSMPFIWASICYVLPFYYPQLWPLLWLFPALLFHALYSQKPSFKTLIFLSIATISFQLLPLGDALIKMAPVSLLKFVPPALLVLYVSLYVIVWLSVTQKIIKAHDVFFALAAWTTSLWVYFLFIEYALLWPFGRMEGYIFMNPLLPMAVIPQLLAPLSYFSLVFVLLWFCCITSTIYAAYKSKNPKHKLLLAILVVPWLLMTFQNSQDTPPSWLNNVGHLPLSLAGSVSSDAGQAVICHELDQLYQQNPYLKLVIMPESSWNSAVLTDKMQLDWLVGHPIQHIIIGSFAQEQQNYFNSLYWYCDGIQIERYDKRQAVPLAERITLRATTLCSKLYFQKSPPVCPSKKPHQSLNILEITRFMPYICSELYCNTHPDDHSKDTLLVTSNDSWFMSHFQKLMALAARFRAIQWHRAILYISFHYAQFFDQFGTASPIATTPSSRMIH